MIAPAPVVDFYIFTYPFFYIINYIYLQIGNSKSYLSTPRAFCTVQQN
jgi:hypothetical protein